MTTPTTTDEAALLAAICDNPAEDTVRLAYADWLEENGQGERAEFVRVQCELARMQPQRHHITWPRWEELRRRESELHGSAAAMTWRPLPWGMSSRTDWERGFLWRVSCTLADWLRFGPEIVRRQPVTAVRISDREPWNAAGVGWRWWWDGEREAADENELPEELYDLVTGGYRSTRDLAHAALSDACLAWAKRAKLIAHG